MTAEFVQKYSLTTGQKPAILAAMYSDSRSLFSRAREIFTQEQLADKLSKGVRTIRRLGERRR